MSSGKTSSGSDGGKFGGAGRGGGRKGGAAGGSAGKDRKVGQGPIDDKPDAATTEEIEKEEKRLQEESQRMQEEEAKIKAVGIFPIPSKIHMRTNLHSQMF